MSKVNSLLIPGLVLTFIAVGFANNAVAQSPPVAQAPEMNEELMTRLIKRALAAKVESRINKLVAGILGLNDGSVDLPAKQIGITTPEGKHTILVCTEPSTKAIVFAFMRGDVNEIYLVDETGKLRTAMTWDTSGMRLNTSEQVLEKFKAEMAFFAKRAEQLPATLNSASAN